MMTSITELGKSIVRVFDQNRNIVGVGFLATEKSIITCSHVISRAGEFDKPVSLGTNVVIDFPLIATSQQLQARVIFNLSSEEIDFAELELEHTLPKEAKPFSVLTNTENILGHRISAYGFPNGYNDGIWAVGVIKGRNAKGWIQVDGIQESGYRIQSGFSGGPVWDEELKTVIGILVAADSNEKARVAFVLPVAAIIKNHINLREKLRLVNYHKCISDAMELLENREYDKLLKFCDKNLEEGLDDPNLHIFAAVALAKGKPIDRLDQNTVQLIENHLIRATLDNTTEGTALAMLGAAKFDFYVINGIQEKRPTFRQISKRLRDLDSQSIDFRILSYLKISEGAFRNMGLK